MSSSGPPTWDHGGAESFRPIEQLPPLDESSSAAAETRDKRATTDVQGSRRSLWHLLGVILFASGIATTAYAGVRIIVDQRMATLYRERVPLGAWGILLLGLIALLAGVVLIVTNDRHH